MTRALLVVFALASITSVAQAQDTDDQARIHFQAGTNYFQVADYDAALREYQRAFDLSERPDLLYNLYLCHERLGNLAEAVGHLERFLAEGDDVPNRELLQQRLRTMRTRLAAQSTEPEPVSEPEPEPVSEPEPEPEPEPAVASSQSSSTVIVNTGSGSTDDGGVPGGAIAMFVIGGIFTAGTAVLGSIAIVEDNELDARCFGGCSADETDGLAAVMIFTDISLGIAATAWVVGTIWAILGSGGGSDEPSVTEARVTPWIDDTSGGVVGTFTF